MKTAKSLSAFAVRGLFSLKSSKYFASHSRVSGDRSANIWSYHSTIIAGLFRKPNPSRSIEYLDAPSVGESPSGSQIVKYFCESSWMRKALNAALASVLNE